MTESTAAEVVALASARMVSLATAESLTGGGVAAALTGVAGASSVVRGGVVAYASDLKVALLGVSQSIVDHYGVVSAECAKAMAEGVRDRLGVTYGIATTGVAGPGEQEGKPVGRVFVAVAGPGSLPAEVEELSLTGDRDQIRRATVAHALEFTLRVLRREEPAVG
jgi:PncC family amidohydrolase